MPRSPEYDLIMSELTFDWVNIEDLISKLSGKVLPGKAVREYQQAFDLHRAKAKGTGPAKGPLPQDQQIYSGARSILRGALRSAELANNVQIRKIANVTYVRRNVFTADEVEAIVADKVSNEIQIPQVIADALIPHIFDTLMFDIRTVKTVEVRCNQDKTNVTITFKDVLDKQNLTVALTEQAADWLSDQLGIQALMARNGADNPRKAIPHSSRFT